MPPWIDVQVVTRKPKKVPFTSKPGFARLFPFPKAVVHAHPEILSESFQRSFQWTSTSGWGRPVES